MSKFEIADRWDGYTITKDGKIMSGEEIIAGLLEVQQAGPEWLTVIIEGVENPYPEYRDAVDKFNTLKNREWLVVEERDKAILRAIKDNTE